jgi:anti-sigma regulatory factor (Ser/Thr protein kinase)
VTERRFPAQAVAVTMCRRFVATSLADVPAETRCVAELMASELATNAITHAASEFTVRVEHDDHRIKVEVSDEGTALPCLRNPSEDEVHGRGLHIVNNLADTWGSRANPGGGKTIWFALHVGGNVANAQSARASE